MKFNAPKLGLATAIVFAGVWVICSTMFVLVQDTMSRMSGYMLHADLGHMGWSIHWTGFFLGLILWTVLPAMFVWAIAALYNRLIGDGTAA